MKVRRRIYMDHAAATPLSREAARAVRRTERLFGNPSSPHAEGEAAREALHEARATIARFVNAKTDEVVLCGSGTEANAVAIMGAAEAVRSSMRSGATAHVIVGGTEHPSVLENVRLLSERGVSVSIVAPRPDGIVEPAGFSRALRPDTFLVSIQQANSETGVIQPVREISQCLPEGVLVHVDACQSARWLPVRIDMLRADLVSLDGGKLGGPKGIGALIVKRGARILPIARGGSQERGLRAGTENLSGAAGFAAAAAAAAAEREGAAKKTASLRDLLLREIRSLVPDILVNGSLRRRLPNNLNISAPGALAELVVARLDAEGVAASAGTACAASEGPSPTLLSMFPSDPHRAECGVRFSLHPSLRAADMRRAAKAYADAVAYARACPRN